MWAQDEEAGLLRGFVFPRPRQLRNRAERSNPYTMLSALQVGTVILEGQIKGLRAGRNVARINSRGQRVDEETP